jgi:hypothetical protein
MCAFGGEKPQTAGKQRSALQGYSGVYWSTEGDWNSILTVANFGDEPDKVTIEIAYNGGTFVLPEIRLSPLQSTTVDFRRLVLDGTKDRNGKPFPKDVHHGGYQVYGNPFKSQLVVKEQLLSGRLGIAAPFYQVCNYVVAYFLNPGSVTLNLGDSTLVTSYCVFNTMVVQPDSGSSFSAPTVASLSGSGASRTVLGVSGGTGVLGGTSSNVPIDMSCFMTYLATSINVQVKKQASLGNVTFSNPTSIFVGGKVTVSVPVTASAQNGSNITVSVCVNTTDVPGNMTVTFNPSNGCVQPFAVAAGNTVAKEVEITVNSADNLPKTFKARATLGVESGVDALQSPKDSSNTATVQTP